MENCARNRDIPPIIQEARQREHELVIRDGPRILVRFGGHPEYFHLAAKDVDRLQLCPVCGFPFFQKRRNEAACSPLHRKFLERERNREQKRKNRDTKRRNREAKERTEVMSLLSKLLPDSSDEMLREQWADEILNSRKATARKVG